MHFSIKYALANRLNNSILGDYSTDINEHSVTVYQMMGC